MPGGTFSTASASTRDFDGRGGIGWDELGDRGSRRPGDHLISALLDDTKIHKITKLYRSRSLKVLTEPEKVGNVLRPRKLCAAAEHDRYSEDCQIRRREKAPVHNRYDNRENEQNEREAGSE